MNASDDDLLNEAAAAIHAGTQATAQAPLQWWSVNNAMTMSAVVLAFGMVILTLSAWLMRAGQPATAVLRVFGTILIIVMATFLVVAGYDDKQIAAPLGLLGTIAGYLLGRESGKGEPRE